MRILVVVFLLLSSIYSHAQERNEPHTVLYYIEQQQYKEALAAIRSGGAIEENDLPALLEYNSRTQLLLEKPYGHEIILTLMDSLLARLTYFNGVAGLCTPMGHAIANGDSATVRILLAKGSKAGADDIVHIAYDLNAFQYAALKHPAEPYPAEGLAILKMLRAAGADITSLTLMPFQTHVTHTGNVDLPAGANALDIAVASGAPKEIIEYLHGLGLNQMVKK